MLKRKFRLPRGVKFNNCRIISNPLFTLKAKENRLLTNRFSIVVSKKIDKRAVVRNRIRRLLNSCIQEFGSELQKGYDMIIIVKKSALGKKREEIFPSIHSVIQRGSEGSNGILRLV
jgi:ribonuclease P protein component